MLRNSNTKFLYHQLLFQVMFVGMTVGLFRTVVPALAEEKFAIPANSLLLLGTFVIVFGLVKATLNLVAGKLSDRIGRRNILIGGWLIALPIPYLLAYAETWSWIIYASILLGINQGFCWSMSQTMKLDITHPSRTGATVGLNETFGYAGVAITSYLSAWATSAYGMQTAMMVLGFAVIGAALILAQLFCSETRQSVYQEHSEEEKLPASHPKTYQNVQRTLCFSGMATKFVDTLIWLVFPVFLYQNNFSLSSIGVISSVYALTWGLSQMLMGAWSDSIGRKSLIVTGIGLCAISCLLLPFSFHFVWWLINAFVLGIGTAMFYPTMSVAINDYADDQNRGGMLGIYRFWRDFGYFLGAIVLGVAVVITDQQVVAFYCVSAILFLSIVLLQRYLPHKKN